MLIQIHLLQNYAPSNLNRDDSGAPKDAIFGGLRRGRISSQCLKRSIRKSLTFAEAFKGAGLLGMRTKALPKLIGDQLAELGADEVTRQAIVTRLTEVGRESKKEEKGEATEERSTEGAEAEESPGETKQLIFLGASELRPLAERLLTFYQKQDPKKWEKVKLGEITHAMGTSVPRSVDIAMFGRMTTSEVFEDVAAAVQVAHALSTNAHTPEFDYYTAVDDLSGESGAGMIGDVEFGSSTYYKYLSVHWEQLVENLGGDLAVARQAVLALVEAAVFANPTGKQNSFAAHNLPDLVLLEMRAKNLPISYANAFLKPARAWGERSLMDASVGQLAGYIQKLSRTYGLNGHRAFTAVEESHTLPGAEAKSSLPELLDWLAAHLSEPAYE